MGTTQRFRVLELPTEILESILEWLPFSGRIRSAHVCRTLRHIALSHHLLWSKIPTLKGPEMLDTLLEWSCSVPVDIQAIYLMRHLAAAEVIGHALSKHLHRIRRLGIFVRDGWDRPPTDSFPAIEAALLQPAPTLEQFHFEDSSHSMPRLTKEPLFNGWAPKLSDLHMNAQPRDLACFSGLHSVLTLKLDRGQVPIPTRLRDIAGVWPNLIRLSLDLGQTYHWQPLVAGQSPVGLDQFPALEDLTFIFSDGTEGRGFDGIRHHPIRVLALRSESPTPPDIALRIVQKTHPSSASSAATGAECGKLSPHRLDLEVFHNMCTMAQARLSYGNSGVARLYRLSTVGLVNALAAESFAHLTHATLKSWSTAPLGNREISLPALKDLTYILHEDCLLSSFLRSLFAVTFVVPVLQFLTFKREIRPEFGPQDPAATQEFADVYTRRMWRSQSPAMHLAQFILSRHTVPILPPAAPAAATPSPLQQDMAGALSSSRIRPMLGRLTLLGLGFASEGHDIAVLRALAAYTECSDASLHESETVFPFDGYVPLWY